MQCPNCGYNSEGDVAFCPMCGAPMSPAQDGQSAGNGYDGPQSGNGDYGNAQGANNSYGPQGQDSGYGPQGQNNGYGPQGQNNGYGPQGQNNAYGSQGQNNAYGSQGQNNAYGSQGQYNNGYGPQGQNNGYGPQGQNNNYGPQGQYNGGNNGGFSAPIKRRSIAVSIILTIVTCGIYGIYWFICLVNDLNTACDDNADYSGGIVFLLNLVTCSIYGWYWFYKAGKKVDYLQSRRMGYANNSGSGTSILYLILSIFGLGIINFCLIQNELNNVAAYD